ncbi:MAG: hypothetical protein GYB65_19620, partial [Chloroflexi bacterium]|nr:hypothetical protein [Chloroflexota bacterium]
SSTIGALAELLLDQGVVYLCAWGPDCERVHDIADERIVWRELEIEPKPPVIMTTWHTDDTLDDMLWFLLNVADPDPAYEPTCHTRLALCIDNPSWAEQIERRLNDPQTLNREMRES